MIMFRRVGRFKLAIWQIMGIGAIAVIVTFQISPLDALRSVNLDVILFLFGVFVIGQALDSSGYLSSVSERIFRKAGSVDMLVVSVLFLMGLSSAFLMNDTVAIIGTPVVLLLSKANRISPKLMLLALAFSITIGSVMSPIGNPQNLLIALEGTVENPFVEFAGYLFIPTIINLLTAYLLLRLFFRDEFRKELRPLKPEPLKDRRLALLSRVSLSIMFFLILVKIILVFLDIGGDIRLTYIALISMAPILLLHRSRFQLVRSIDWHTLLFFVSMFILMGAVWNTGFFQDILESSFSSLTSIPMVFLVSILASQLISNVPLVALYMPMLAELGVSSRELIALAAGSTIAGNLTLIGAASNVIIVQNAEKRTGDTLTFFDFIRIGFPLTVLNSLVYLVFFMVLS
ncbi:MAG: anion transporter [Thermoplasmatota archaeon]